LRQGQVILALSHVNVFQLATRKNPIVPCGIVIHFRDWLWGDGMRQAGFVWSIWRG